MNIEITKKHIKYLLFQRNQYISKFQLKIKKMFGRYLFTNIFVNFFNSKHSITKSLNEDFKIEFDSIKNFIPKNASNILDIGCGLGVINIFLNSFYSNKCNFTLIDKTYVNKKITYGFSNKGEFYNNLELTKSFLLLNKLEENQIELVDASKDFVLKKKYDLIISLFSMGYHYPIDLYIEKIKKISNKDTKIIFDLSLEYNSIELLNKYFNNIKIIKEDHNVKQNYVRLLCTGVRL